MKIRMEGERTSGPEISKWMEAERLKWLDGDGGWRRGEMECSEWSVRKVRSGWGGREWASVQRGKWMGRGGVEDKRSAWDGDSGIEG